LFLGGASPAAETELRPSSFKGLLRFWFRAAALPALGSWRTVQEVENEFLAVQMGKRASISASWIPVN